MIGAQSLLLCCRGDRRYAPLTAGDRPVALFVVGMGRSGSSALARVLSLCGAALPPGLLGPTRDSPRGYFEPRAAIQINEDILRSHGSSGYDPSLRMQDEGAMSAEDRAAWVERIRRYLSGLPAAPLTVIKEPKIALLGALWFEAAQLAGFDVVTAISVRHPGEVIESLARRGQRQRYVHNSPALVAAWWLKYTLLAERDTRGLPRAFVDYDNLLADWRREMKRVSLALGIDLSGSDDAAIEEYLCPELRHHQDHGPAPEPFGTDWLSASYQAVGAAARDESCDLAALDRVYEQYRAGERGFRLAFDGYRRYRHLSWLMPSGVVRLGLRALPLAQRRHRT